MLPNASKLKEHSVEELEELRNEVDKAIRAVEKRRRKDALNAAENAAKEFGFSLEEIVNGSPVKKTSKNPPKYRNPNKPSQTWTGHGMRPRWFRDLVESGTPEEDLLIK